MLAAVLKIAHAIRIPEQPDQGLPHGALHELCRRPPGIGMIGSEAVRQPVRVLLSTTTSTSSAI